MNFCVMPFDEFGRWYVRFRRRLLHFLAVLINAGQKENVFAFQSMIARNHIGQDFFVSVADVRWRIRVIDRRSDEKCLRHFCASSVAAVSDCRKRRRSEMPLQDLGS